MDNILKSSQKQSPANWNAARRVAANASSPSRPENPWRPFPLDALPTVVRDFAAEIGRTICVDESVAILPMISVAGACIGNSARAKMSGDYFAPPNIWTCPLLRSGERKSPVLNAVMRPIYDRQADLSAEHARQVAQYRSDLERWKLKPKPDRGDAPVEPPGFPHLYVADATPEAIALRLADQPRGLIVVVDELSGLFRGVDQYKSGGKGNGREFFLQAYDAGPAKIDRKSATPPTIFIPRAFVTVTGMIQPAMLARVLRPDDYASGLAARFMLAAPPPRRATWTADGIADNVREAWNNLLIALLAMPVPEKPLLIAPTDGAMSLWASAHDRLDAERYNEPDDRMRAARAKLIGLIPRLALVLEIVYAASDQRPAVRSISDASMGSAIAISEWARYETARVYGLLSIETEGDDDDAIIRRIQDAGGQCSVRNLMQWSRQFRGSATAAESYLASLAKDGAGRWEWQNTAGRPVRVFILCVGGDGNRTPTSDPENGASVTEASVTVTALPGGNGGGL